jgi:hypothetical protein
MAYIFEALIEPIRGGFGIININALDLYHQGFPGRLSWTRTPNLKSNTLPAGAKITLREPDRKRSVFPLPQGSLG